MRISLQTSTISYFYTRNKDIICFNKNLIISGICSLIIAAAATEYIYNTFHHGGNDIIVITLVSVLTEYCIETPIFIALSYYDCKNRYIELLTRKRNQVLIKNQIKKLFVVYSISDALYFIAQIILLGYLLQISGLLPYQSVIYSSLMGWTIYFLGNNVLIKISKFK
jgi:hypothetical protein